MRVDSNSSGIDTASNPSTRLIKKSRYSLVNHL